MRFEPAAKRTVLQAFNEHRQLLFGIAYRMLGRVSEAEDLVQEVWLRWHKQEAREIQSAKAWLVATMTRLCIDQLRSARRQREEYYGVWLPEPLMTAAAPAPDTAAELADSLTMAFLMMLETLGPAERAVFLLREVFDYDYPVIADIVEKSEANCRQIVRRAKMQLDAKPKAPLGPNAQTQQLVEQFLSAMQTGEVQQLLDLLAADATVYSDGGGRVRAAGRPIVSADHVSRFFAGIQPRLPADTEYRSTFINGRVGALMYTGGAIYGAISFELEAGQVRNIYVILNPDKLRHLARSGWN